MQWDCAEVLRSAAKCEGGGNGCCACWAGGVGFQPWSSCRPMLASRSIGIAWHVGLRPASREANPTGCSGARRPLCCPVCSSSRGSAAVAPRHPWQQRSTMERWAVARFGPRPAAACRSRGVSAPPGDRPDGTGPPGWLALSAGRPPGALPAGCPCETFAKLEACGPAGPSHHLWGMPTMRCSPPHPPPLQPTPPATSWQRHKQRASRPPSTR